VEQVNLVSRKHLQRVLLLGLCASALLLLSALLVAYRTVYQINELTGEFADRQALSKSSIDGIEREQTQLNERWRRLARKDIVRREEILDQLQQNRNEMSKALESAYQQAELLRESIYQAGHGLLRSAVWLFGLCVLLSIAGAVWAVRVSTGLFKRLESQTDELSSLQYAFLETQEKVARRFSHELHDELGQSLTAMKANLSALRAETSSSRVEDCMTLVEDAIRDVREMSQLLRPTMLDDFGLDAALHALTDTFTQRTGIEVTYQSAIHNLRLNEETETNLFRIAQEALTNVARHSEATEVQMSLEADDKQVHLRVRDNGHGAKPATKGERRGLGLAGMQMRARGCGGTLTVKSDPGKGFSIAVSCPVGEAHT
jgi:signal transduction histidine kinase